MGKLNLPLTNNIIFHKLQYIVISGYSENPEVRCILVTVMVTGGNW